MSGRTFSQAEASRLSGVSLDVMRDWRRRGFLDGLGEQNEAGRWAYSLEQITVLAIAVILQKDGLSLQKSIRAARYLRVQSWHNVESQVRLAFGVSGVQTIEFCIYSLQKALPLKLRQLIQKELLA